MRLLVPLLLGALVTVECHGYILCPAPRQRRDDKVEVWTYWQGIGNAVHGETDRFYPGQTNAANLNAGIGGGNSFVWGAEPGSHGLCGDIKERKGVSEGPYGATAPRGTFVAGGVMDVQIKINADHSGWFEFRLASPSSPSAPLTQDLLNAHVLEIDESTPGYPGVLDYQALGGE